MNNLLSPELILKAYSVGCFPMSEARGDEEVFWVSPDERGVLPFDEFHIPKSMRRFVRNHPYHITADRDFTSVIKACATIRDDTWINREIERVYIELHGQGHAHSVEVWDEQDELVGGLYGLSINGAFFGESMFSTATNTSKLALIALMAHLHSRGFTLCDAQFVNDHLLQFGCQEIPHDNYMVRLVNAIQLSDVSFSDSSAGESFSITSDCIDAFAGRLQSITQTS